MRAILLCLMLLALPALAAENAADTVYAMSAVEHMLRDIRFTMEQSREISLKKWRKRSVFRRLAENMLRIFTIWM